VVVVVGFCGHIIRFLMLMDLDGGCFCVGDGENG
jgi:hypothetical protein